MRKTDAAWLAGIIDGEGCIQTHLTPFETVRLLITIVNTNENIVEKCKELTGCKNYIVRYDSQLGYKPRHVVQIPARKALQVLSDVSEYLVGKKMQCYAALKFLPGSRGKPSSNFAKTNNLMVYASLRLLNRRGLRAA